jgi:multiple sugar transport system permease protein
MFPRPIQQASHAAQIGYQLVLVVFLFLWLVPVIGIALTSFKSTAELASGNYFGLPASFAPTNYINILANTDMVLYMTNSLKVTIPSVIGAVAMSCLTGYALAVYQFRSKLFIFFVFVAGNFVPFQILMIPVRDLTLELGLYNRPLGLILFHIAFQTGFCTLFMRNFIKALPFELIESARAEGVSEFRIFFYIVLPLVRPAIAALSVLIFTFVWNEYFWATVLNQDAKSMPVTAGLYSLNGEWIAAWNLVSAGCIIAALPPAIVFFLMQRQFIAGLTMGATKG